MQAATHRSAGIDEGDVALEPSHRPVERAVDGLVFIFLVGGLNYQCPLTSRGHDPKGIRAVQTTSNHPGLGGSTGAVGGRRGVNIPLFTTWTPSGGWGQELPQLLT